MAEHINQHNLELLFLSPDSVSAEEKEQIHIHLKECALCNEHWQRLSSFYQAIDETFDSQPTERDKAFADGLLAKRRIALPERGVELRKQTETLRETFENYVEVIEPYKRSLAKRFVRYVQIHPVRFAGETLSFGAAALALTVFFSQSPREGIPVLATVKNAVLNVYDKEGDVLWTRSAVGIPDIRSDEKWDPGIRGQKVLSVDDIDGDGTNEILLTGYIKRMDFSPDTIYCFDRNGEVRWQAGGGEMISFGKQAVSQHSTTLIIDWIVLTKNPQARKQLFVVRRDYAFSPSKLFELDPKTGEELHAYYNRGHAQNLIASDADKNGNIDLILGGINDSFNSAFIAVFDPDALSGHAPVVPSHLPTSTGFGTEKYYILFPRTEVGNAIGTSPYNQISHIEPRYTGGLVAWVEDVVRPGDTLYRSFSIVYTFGADMKCSRAIAGDGARPTVDELFNSGRIKHRFTPDEIDALKDSVLYWDGEKFVHTPTMNKRYKGILHSLP